MCKRKGGCSGHRKWSKADKERKCEACKIVFELKPPVRITNKPQRFCSRLCANRAHALIAEASYQNCKLCGVQFYTKGKSHKRQYCSHKCRNIRKRRGINGGMDSNTQKRKYIEYLATSGKLLACEVCTFSNPREILQVHHKDKNRANGDLSNLILLCPNCHCTTHHHMRKNKRVKMLEWWAEATQEIKLHSLPLN